MMELVFKRENAVQELPQMLAFNYDELKNGLSQYLEKYKGLVVTQDDIKTAEGTRASINKIRDAIKRARISVKKQAFDQFEAKAKELEKMCDDVNEGIAEQLRNFEELRKQKKLELVKPIMEEAIESSTGDNRIIGNKFWETFLAYNWSKSKGAWANSTVSTDTIRQEVCDKVQEIIRDWDSLSGLLENDSIEVRTIADERFSRDFDLNCTVQYIKNFKEEQKRIADAKAKAEALKAAQESEKKSEPEVVIKVPDAPKMKTVEEKTYTYQLEVSGTLSALKAMKEYGLSLGLTFRKLGE